MLRCIAIDDEELALELLEDNIRKLPYLQLVGSFNNPLEAMKLVQEKQVDLVFIDIQMPGITGLQFIQSLPGQTMFILVTAYEKFALEGYNLNVVDYLVKPVELDRFIKACNKALELHQLRTNQQSSTGNTPDYFFVNVEYSLFKILKSDIRWVEGYKDYIKVYLKSSPQPVITRMSIKGIEELLGSKDFFRIHKSFIVSLASITSVRKNSVFIDNNELPLSDNYRESFLAAIGRS